MKSTKRIKMTMGIVVFFIFLTASFASAEILDKSEHWKNFVAIYGWVPAINGDVNQRGGCECGRHLFRCSFQPEVWVDGS